MDLAIDKLTKATAAKKDSVILLTDGSTGQSYYMTIEELIQDSLDAMGDMLKFGTMVYEDKQEYALVHHDHDAYSQFSYQKSQSYPSSQSTEVIARVTSNGTTTQIECPLYSDVKRFEQYDIGELRFSYDKHDTIEIASQDFDGWVRADGSSYNASLFAASNRDFLKEFFPCASNQNSIQVPDLRNKFFRPDVNGCSNNETQLQTVQFQNGIKPHTHVYGIPTSTEITSSELASGTCQINIATKEVGRPKKRQLLAVKENESSEQKTVQTEISCSWSVDVQTSDQIQDQESYPDHTKIPVLIFLGPNSSQQS